MIRVKKLTKYFWNEKVLDDISFEIEEWTICWFIWENGAGKSTTMRILSSLILDYSGEVYINGVLLDEKSIINHRRIIGFMPDQYGLYDDLTITQYLEFFMNSYGLEVDHRRIEEVLESVQLWDKKQQSIKWLSRGMTQRVLLAKSLVVDPKILILDEPASWLDPKLRIMLKNLLLSLKQQGKTIFVSSHILSELWEYCDKVILLEGGKIIKQGSTHEVFQYLDEEVKQEESISLHKDYKCPNCGTICNFH